MVAIIFQSQKCALKAWKVMTKNSVLTYPQSMFTGDEQMYTRMRLKPPYKFDSEGNQLPDLDKHGKLKFVRRKWYAHFSHKKQPIGNSLDAYEPETKKAQMNLGRLIEKLDNGIIVGGVNKRFKFLIPDEKSFFTSYNYYQLWRDHLKVFLGEHRVGELNPQLIEEYMEARYKLNEDDELQVMQNTFQKEMVALQQVVRSVDPHYSVSKKLLDKINFNKIYKEQFPPLTPEQLYQATLQAKGYWGDIFLIMLYTGMEGRDVFDLKPEHIKDGVITKLRHKNKYKTKKTTINMPICDALKKVFDRIPTPASKHQCYFKIGDEYKHARCSSAIRDIFTKAGLQGYGAKSLRRYMGEEINSQYMFEANKAAQEALAHSSKSNQTGFYTRPRNADLRVLVDRLAERIAKASGE